MASRSTKDSFPYPQKTGEDSNSDEVENCALLPSGLDPVESPTSVFQELCIEIPSCPLIAMIRVEENSEGLLMTTAPGIYDFPGALYFITALDELVGSVGLGFPGKSDIQNTLLEEELLGSVLRCTEFEDEHTDEIGTHLTSNDEGLAGVADRWLSTEDLAVWSGGEAEDMLTTHTGMSDLETILNAL